MRLIYRAVQDWGRGRETVWGWGRGGFEGGGVSGHPFRLCRYKKACCIMTTRGQQAGDSSFHPQPPAVWIRNHWSRAVTVHCWKEKNTWNSFRRLLYSAQIASVIPGPVCYLPLLLTWISEETFLDFFCYWTFHLTTSPRWIFYTTADKRL
jgi:hypothetical protein